MQHTLIPLKDRQRLHREYAIRTVAVFFFALAASVVVGVVALFPAYIQAWFYDRAARDAASVVREEKTDESLGKIKTELSTDAKLLAVLADRQVDVKFSDIMRSLMGARGSARITSFVLNQMNTAAVVITLKGTAPTRDDLIALRGRLEGLMPGTKVEIPIDQLAKTADLEFTLKFSKQLP